MNGIPTDNYSFAILILASRLGGMTLFADGGRTQTSVKRVCSPPQWGGGELHGSKNRKSFRSGAHQIYVNFGNRRLQTRSTVTARHFGTQGCAVIPAVTVWYGK